MKTINIFLLLIIATISILFTSCETEVTGVNLPYEETIIVYGVLTAGELSDGIYLARTVPPLETPTTENSKITDAEVIIQHNDKPITLVYDHTLFYKTTEPIVPQYGDKFELTIKWKGKTYNSKTYIPQKYNSENINFTYNVRKDIYNTGSYIVSINTKFEANTDDTYLIGEANVGRLGFNDTSLYYRNAFKGSSIAKPLISQNANTIYTDDTTYASISNMINNFETKYFSVVELLDIQYYNFFITRYNGDGFSSIFGTSGSNIQGNISNRGLGLFVGRNRIIKQISNITRE